MRRPNLLPVENESPSSHASDIFSSAICRDLPVENVHKVAELVRDTIITLVSLQKRKGLEEAKPLSLSRRTSGIQSPGTATAASISLPKVIDSSQLFEKDIIKLFMHSFLPTNVSERSSSSRQWLYQASTQAQPDTALHLALGALSLSRVGHINKNQELIWQGQTVYCRALPALQKALFDERYMWHESTLAAGRTLEKYEFWEGSEESIEGWESHLEGMSRLVELRGTRGYSSSLERNIFRDFRRGSLIQCLMQRKSSFLGSSAWRTEPWIDYPKFTEDELYDIGFTMASLFEEIDTVFKALPEVSRDRLEDIARRFYFIDMELKSWYDRFVAESPAPLFWMVPSQQARSAFDVSHGQGEKDAASPFNSKASYCFASLRLASNTLLYWGLQLALYTHITLFTSTATMRAQHQDTSSPSDNSFNVDLASHEPLSYAYLSSSSTFGPTYPPKLPIIANDVLYKIGRQVLLAIPFCARDDMGDVGPEATIFALRCAMWVYNQIDDPEGKKSSKRADTLGDMHCRSATATPSNESPEDELDDTTWCRQMYKALTKDKGMSFARGMAKGWERGEIPAIFLQGTPDLRLISRENTPEPP
ncbi:MAG: hypothetical protein M1828_004057 [Chrysothrix sp. TS-e1954]|nr:MAG: hypothetical protein M1828_004057 [Chrysothrix sp. TS-e1954]